MSADDAQQQPDRPDRNLALELVRVTEAAALAAARMIGMGDKEGADQAAVDAMRLVLGTVHMDGVVVIGEGEKDEAPMLYIGERIGNGQPPRTDIAVDPIDGTTVLSKGLPNALAVVALAERGTMYYPPNIVYMEKIAVGPIGKGRISLEATPEENLRALAAAKDCDVSDLTVMILDRPRHEHLIAQIRQAGARIRLISDGDVAGALIAAMEEHTGVDLLMGIGGAPEAVIAACALKCIDGDMQCRLWPRSEEEKQAAIANGLDAREFDRVLTIDDLCSSDNVFFAATGITNGELLRGVQYYGRGAHTHSLSMRSRSGTARWIEAQHRWERLMAYTGAPYDQQVWRDRTRAKSPLTTDQQKS